MMTVRTLRSGSGSASKRLNDLRQVSQPLWASFHLQKEEVACLRDPPALTFGEEAVEYHEKKHRPKSVSLLLTSLGSSILIRKMGAIW